MNKGDHVSEHEDKNDSNPHDKRFIFQDFPVKRALFLTFNVYSVTVTRRDAAFWPINQRKRG